VNVIHPVTNRLKICNSPNNESVNTIIDDDIFSNSISCHLMTKKNDLYVQNIPTPTFNITEYLNAKQK
jgi:hypothetical protein